MKGNLIIMGCFAAGIAAARMDLLPAWLLSQRRTRIHTLGTHISGRHRPRSLERPATHETIIRGGHDPAARGHHHRHAALLGRRGIPARGTEALPTVSPSAAGFGYYSLSSVLIADMKGAAPDAAELATIALLANIIREMSALFGASLFARWGGRYAPISVAGINSMDVCLPTIVREAHDKDVVPLAVTHGHGSRGERTDTDRYILRWILLTPKRMRTIMTDIACGVPDGAFIYSHRPAEPHYPYPPATAPQDRGRTGMHR